MSLLTSDERNRLIDLLLSLPLAGEDQGRRALLGGLPRALSDSISFAASARTVVTTIIDVLNDGPWTKLPDGTCCLLVIIENVLPSVAGSATEATLQTWRNTLQTRIAPEPVLASPAAPPRGNPFYGDSRELVDRTDELRRAGDKLQAANHCSIVGPPGSGKTLLLRELKARLLAQMGWQPSEWLLIRFRTISALRELQQQIVEALGGQRVADIRRVIRANPLRLLALDDLGWMGIGDEGLKMRRWLRGFAEDNSVQLLITSNKPLDILFRADDPTVDSPFENLDKLPVLLLPWPPSICRQLVQQRLAGTTLSVDQFAEQCDQPRQPKELLNLCAARYDELVGS